MYQVVRIGEKDVPMLAMASVDNYYQQIFGEDPLKVQAESIENDSIAVTIELFKKMGFVMAKFAELMQRKEMLKLNTENYLEWLDQFDRGDMMDAIWNIRRVYEGQKVGDAEEKKEEDQ